jgi:DNA-binding MarR family transcriptional regulator
MFEKSELRVLDALDVPKRRQELAAELGYEPGTITNAVSHLETVGLVTREKEGNETVVHPTNARCLEVYQSLTRTNPHVDVPELLTSSMLRVLYYLPSDTGVSATELTESSGVSRATVYRVLKTLTNRAIAVKEDSRYRLTEQFAGLHEFAEELRHHAHRTRVRNDLGSGTLLWESYDEFLVRTESETGHPEYLRTGLDAFSEYGLDFFTPSGYYYFYTEDRESLCPADLVCHLLLIENDVRHRKYAMLLVASTETSHESVRDAAAAYGIEETVIPLLEYLQTHGEHSSAQSPPWEEMESLARDYGVAL